MKLTDSVLVLWSVQWAQSCRIIHIHNSFEIYCSVIMLQIITYHTIHSATTGSPGNNICTQPALGALRDCKHAPEGTDG